MRIALNLHSYIKPITKYKVTASTVAEFPFRSIQEIAAYLSHVQAEVRSASTQTPSIASLEEISRINGVLKTLDATSNTVFRRSASAVATTIASLQSTLDTTQKSVLQSLTLDAPPIFGEALVKSTLKKYLKQEPTVYRIKSKNLQSAQFVFSKVLTYQGFEYPEFHVTLSRTLDGAWLNSFYRYHVPSMTLKGTKVNQLKEDCTRILRRDGFI